MILTNILNKINIVYFKQYFSILKCFKVGTFMPRSKQVDKRLILLLLLSIILLITILVADSFLDADLRAISLALLFLTIVFGVSVIASIAFGFPAPSKLMFKCLSCKKKYPYQETKCPYCGKIRACSLCNNLFTSKKEVWNCPFCGEPYHREEVMKLVEVGTYTCLKCKSIIGREDFLSKIKAETLQKKKKDKKKKKKEKLEGRKRKKRNIKRRMKKKRD